MTDEQIKQQRKEQAAETRKRNQERRAERIKRQEEFCKILMELMQSPEVSAEDKAVFAKIFAKANCMG
jgi:anionic cell wall polymer biosynthesis LytR-Cps2A-Psr (LCP) family protein